MLKKIRALSALKKILISISILALLSLILCILIICNEPVFFSLALTIGLILSLCFYWFIGWFELSHKSLFNQPLFWLSILIPLQLFFFIGIWSWKGHSVDFSSDGFNNFLTISKLPLFFLASSVPLTSIVNNIHRTIQTEKQINEAERKNLSDSYYTHFKNTLDLFKNIESKEISLSEQGYKFKLSINSPVSLYNKIYQKSSYKSGADYTVSDYFIDEIKHDWDKINKGIKKLKPLMLQQTEVLSPRKRIRVLINLYRIESAFERICQNLGLGDLEHESRPVYKTTMVDYIGLFHSSINLKDGINELNKICLRIFDIVLSTDEKRKSFNPRYFLQTKVFINYASISHLKITQQTFTFMVSLHFHRKQTKNGDKLAAE